jgi:hypothetical protein
MLFASERSQAASNGLASSAQVPLLTSNTSKNDNDHREWMRSVMGISLAGAMKGAISNRAEF